MLRKILIANRGDVTVRVIRTRRKMGILTVAVFSDTNRTASHAQMVDETVHIGPSPATDSYLPIDRILDAVRPGYGFLSENPNFPETYEKSGIKFTGPSSQAMQLMSVKIRVPQTGIIRLPFDRDAPVAAGDMLAVMK